jgi:hypothetical protein
MTRTGWSIVVVLGVAAGLSACSSGGRTVLQVAADPSGKWVAIVDRVEYANGLLTSAADRVLVAEAGSRAAERGEGTIVFSQDAGLPGEKPTVAWSEGRLVITAPASGAVLHQQTSVRGVQVEIRLR